MEELTPAAFKDDKPWKLKPEYTTKCANMVLFYSPTCPHCLAMDGMWEDLKNTMGTVSVRKMDVQKFSHYRDLITTSHSEGKSPFTIEYVPTIVGYTQTGCAGVFEGDRSLANFKKHAMCLCNTECALKYCTN